ncbi:hypothetical protein K402DRAFT_87835 [Aulographum hederae CBS 113979]|uniref:Uncharacterized protein n=1 Tax=Aulographum hederae CBS 113979 TaxID=1176131 RepID=A0A6G1H021_9PEZI|nr:hypothetical protein K402DRAFT_87835 [Aulographum hederae CBS 113979]
MLFMSPFTRGSISRTLALSIMSRPRGCDVRTVAGIGALLLLWLDVVLLLSKGNWNCDICDVWPLAAEFVFSPAAALGAVPALFDERVDCTVEAMEGVSDMEYLWYEAGGMWTGRERQQRGGGNNYQSRVAQRPQMDS